VQVCSLQAAHLARFGGVHKIQTKRFQAAIGQPNAKAVSVSPLVGFQYATVETLERFRWWCFLRNRRRTEADEHDQESKILIFECEYVQLNAMRSRQLHDALEKLTKAIREVEAVVETMRAEHDPLASHIFISRRQYRNANDTKGGKRREVNARLSFNTACELGFRGSLDEWERLMGAVTRR